jgi:hypothetical protein|tara:strand:+ start:549 stop:695 length:147 start_codon:yes stop_codon:yes gene_type:complete
VLRALVRGEVRGDERDALPAVQRESDHQPPFVPDRIEDPRGLMPDANL